MSKYNTGTIVAIGLVVIVFIGGIVALIIWGMSGSTTTTSSGGPGNSCGIYNGGEKNPTGDELCGNIIGKPVPIMNNITLKKAIMNGNGERTYGGYCDKCQRCAPNSPYKCKQCGVTKEFCKWDQTENPTKTICGKQCRLLLNNN